jgi:flagellar hook-associated protein 1 FlgK
LRDIFNYTGNSAEGPGIPYFMEQLNTLARAIAQEVNAVHRVGWTSEKAQGGSHSNVDFFFVDNTPGFDAIYSLTAGNFRLSDDIINDIYNIAASDRKIVTDPGAPDYNHTDTTHEGNQENMIDMYDIINARQIDVHLNNPPSVHPIYPSGGDIVTIGGLFDYLSSVVNDVAVTLHTSKGFNDARTIQTLAVSNQRESVSGVSLDEEMTNLIKYQHAYGGASRVITAMDEALDTLVNKMGIVGR